MIEPNYAVFRALLKDLKSDMPEDEIYQKYMGVMEPGWSIQHTPAMGEDGMYHYLYLTERDDGKIYIGKHSTKDLNDNYQGSGYDIQDGLKTGRKFKTTKLHFFKTETEAYKAEKTIVNASFINTPRFVLNHAGGGLSDKPDTPALVKKVNAPGASAVMRSVKSNAWSFSRLNVPVGSSLNWLGPKTATCKVLDDWNVEYEGKKMKLTELDKQLGNGVPFCKNTLNSFKLGTKTLNEIKAEIQART